MYTKNEKVYVGQDNKNTFTKSDDEVRRNKELSIVSRIIQIELKSNDPLTWNYSQENIAEALGICKSTVNTALKELKQKGYLYVGEQHRTQKGTFSKCKYFITDIPFEFIDENGDKFYSDDNEPFSP